MGEAILAVLIPPARGAGPPGVSAPARPGTGGQGFAAMVDAPAAGPDGAAREPEGGAAEGAGSAEAATGPVADPPSLLPEQAIPTAPAAEPPPVPDDAAPILALDASLAPRPVTTLDASRGQSSEKGPGEVPGLPPEATRPGRGGAEPALWPHAIPSPGLLRATEVPARPEWTTPAPAAGRPAAHPVLGTGPAAEVLAGPTGEAAAAGPSDPSIPPAPAAGPVAAAGHPPSVQPSALRRPEEVAARLAGTPAGPAARGPSLVEPAVPTTQGATPGGAAAATGPASPPGPSVPQALASAAPPAPPPASPTAPVPPASLPQSGPAPRPVAARGAPGPDPVPPARGPAVGERAEGLVATAPSVRPARPVYAESEPGARPTTFEGPAEALRLAADAPAALVPPAPRAEAVEGATARRIAEGVAQTVAQSPSLRAIGAAEMTLAPEELGTLHLRVEGEGAGLRLVIEALRPETADLLRRHAEVLRQELRQEGLGALSVSIGGGEARGERAAPWAHAGPDTAPESPFAAAGFAAAPATPRPRGPAGGVDLRL